MSYYLETAKPAMLNASRLMGELAESHKENVQGATAAMGQFAWPMMMFFCASTYNESLGFARDAAKDTGEGVRAVSDALKNIVSLYQKLEENNKVK